MSTSTPDRVGASTVLGWLEQPDAVTVIDVRSPAELETAHIAGSYNVPLDLLGEHAAQPADRLDREVVLVRQSGARAARARERLGDVVRGRDCWALERQVRLCAGVLVVAGVAASWRVPAASLLAGRAGLALTDTCTMARVLSSLPHNRSSRQRTAAEILDQLPAATTAT